MKYVVELNEGKDLFDLGDAIKNIGCVNISEYDYLTTKKEILEEFKKWAIDYRFSKTGSHEDGRYCVVISVTDILNELKFLEELMK